MCQNTFKKHKVRKRFFNISVFEPTLLSLFFLGYCQAITVTHVAVCTSFQQNSNFACNLHLLHPINSTCKTKQKMKKDYTVPQKHVQEVL